MSAASPDIAERSRGLVSVIRGFGMMSGGPLLLLAGSIASVVAAARALVHRRRVPSASRVAIAGLVAYVTVLLPWSRKWGATADEARKRLPGDELVDDAGLMTTRAVTIDAPVDEVWAWMAQIGQDRGGFYSYEWLENLAGCQMRNADRIHPEWQHRDVGETVRLHPATGLKLARFEPGRSYAFDGGWCFALEPIDGRTRLIARTRVPRGVASLAYAALIEPPHFIMERKMLLGIKARAEAATQARQSAGS
jgi:hypothetical protein